MSLSFLTGGNATVTPAYDQAMRHAEFGWGSQRVCCSHGKESADAS